MMKPYQFRFALLTWLYLLAFFYNVHGQSAVPSAPVVAPHASGNNINPSLAIMVVVLVCAFLIMGFSSIYIRNCAESYAITQNPIGDCSCSCHGIDPKVLDTFPILVYSTIKDLKFGTEALECAVCLSEFKDNETLRLLPKCNHVFHPECIDTWLSSHVTCPLCRGNLKADCGEVAIVIPTQLNSHEVFDESSVRRAELGEAVQHAIVLNMNEGQRSGNSGANDMSHMTNVDGSQGHPPDSKIFGKYVRSHSTGHSLVERTKTLERHTLRLPEDVKKQILVNHGAIRRSSSYDVILAREESSGKACTCECDTGEGSSKGQKDGAERQSRWLLSMTPPFVSRGWNSATVSANASSSCSGFPRLWSSSSPPHEPL